MSAAKNFFPEAPAQGASLQGRGWVRNPQLSLSCGAPGGDARFKILARIDFQNLGGRPEKQKSAHLPIFVRSNVQPISGFKTHSSLCGFRRRLAAQIVGLLLNFRKSRKIASNRHYPQSVALQIETPEQLVQTRVNRARRPNLNWQSRPPIASR